MPKLYECLYNFTPMNIVAEVAYIVASNTEELYRKMYPFTDFEIVAVGLYHEED